jgi:hypothetical protein
VKRVRVPGYGNVWRSTWRYVAGTVSQTGPRGARGPEPKSFLLGGYLVKVAILLVTTTWLAGAEQAPPAAPAPKAPAAVAPAPAPGPCCNVCDDCCHPSLLDKLRGLFHRSCDSCDSCCDTHCDHKWFHSHSCDVCPKPCPTPCDVCKDTCCGHDLFGKIKGLFHRHCDDCCADCCGGSAPRMDAKPPAAKEPLKMPSEGKPADKKTSQLEPAPVSFDLGR